MEQKQEQNKDFFISYTSVDKTWTEWIAWQLEETGMTTIIQAWDFHAGGNFVLDRGSTTPYTLLSNSSIPLSSLAVL